MAVAENSERREGRKWRIPTQCRRGHVYTDADFAEGTLRRVCRQCKKDRARALRDERGVWYPNRNLARENELRLHKKKTDPAFLAAERARVATYQAKHPDRVAAARRKYINARLKVDHKLRLSRSMAGRIRQTLATGKCGKTWPALVGFNVADLKAHLERQFTKGMTWANYGDWHIDHIVPIASFEYATPDDAAFKACWALTNLRPLWAADNLRKADNRLHLL